MSQRNASHWDINDTLNWLKGAHSLSMGGNFTKVNYWTTTQTAVPALTFGVDTANDPANAMFTNANFPGASTADLNNARALYGLLTGRVTQIGGNYRLDEETGEYLFMGKGRQAGSMTEVGAVRERLVARRARRSRLTSGCAGKCRCRSSRPTASSRRRRCKASAAFPASAAMGCAICSSPAR